MWPRQGLHPLPLQWDELRWAFITASTNTEGQRKSRSLKGDAVSPFVAGRFTPENVSWKRSWACHAMRKPKPAHIEKPENRTWNYTEQKRKREEKKREEEVRRKQDIWSAQSCFKPLWSSSSHYLIGTIWETLSPNLFFFTLLTKVCLVKAMVFPVVMYGCESWTVKKADRRRINAFELWCWRRLLRVPWTARRSNQSILKEISPGISFEGMML